MNIKFRAWNGREMITIDSLYFFEEEGIHEVVNGVGKGAHCDYVIMQYTGLKDVKGVEIYEGDIVMCYPGDLNLMYIKVVKWASDRPNLGITVDSSGLILCESTTNEIEIVGNIYENIDLLEAP